MTILADVHAMRQDMAALRHVAENNRDSIAKHEEQINGKRGLQAAIEDLADQLEALKRVIVGGAITVSLSAIGFGLTVLTQL